MFEIKIDLLNAIKASLSKTYVPAFSGVAGAYKCSTCQGTCKGICSESCSRGCKGLRR